LEKNKILDDLWALQPHADEFFGLVQAFLSATGIFEYFRNLLSLRCLKQSNLGQKALICG